MNVIFLTVTSFTDIATHGIYPDLLRTFLEEGHTVYIVSPRERRYGVATGIVKQGDASILGVKTLNIQKTNVVEKGIGTVLLEYQFKAAIKKYLGGVSFDLILYSTPPITFPKVIQYLKMKNPKAVTYLLLKDIFPQNAVDLGMMGTTGLKGILYRFFRNKEKKLYAMSDFIGCMSPANVQYVLAHNPEVPADRVEVAPNSYQAREPVLLTREQRDAIRSKYGLPLDRPVFIYGGNLGKPQGIPFLIKCLEANADRPDCHFVIIGNGTEAPKLKAWSRSGGKSSVSVFEKLPKEDYDTLVRSCDVGMVFLDYRFTIPNYPSRLLPYLMEKKPVLAATDVNTDIGKIAEENGYGLWCPSNSVEAFTETVDRMLRADIPAMGEAGYRFFLDHYTAAHTYQTIIQHIGQ